jgi:hypothetical protein
MKPNACSFSSRDFTARLPPSTTPAMSTVSYGGGTGANVHNSPRDSDETSLALANPAIARSIAQS